MSSLIVTSTQFCEPKGTPIEHLLEVCGGIEEDICG